MSDKTFTHKITIEVYEPAEGGLCVFPPMHRVEAHMKKIREGEDQAFKALQESGKDDPKTEFMRPSDNFLRNYLEAREIAKDGIKTLSFNYRPYTHGEKLEAKRLATKAYSDENGNEKFRLDQDEYEVHIVSASTGMTRDEVCALHPSIFAYLAEEIFNRTQIAPERLSFFVTSPTS